MTQHRTASFPIVKAALVEILTGATATAAADGGRLQICYGLERDVETERITVGTLAGESAGQAWATLGDRQRTEGYPIHVYIEVARGDETQQGATERAYELFALLENAVREDVHLGLAETFRSLEAQVLQEIPEEWPDGDGEGYCARIDVAISIKTRI